MKLIDAGERVFIRRPRLADADEFLRGVAQSRSLHRPWVYPGTSSLQFETYLRRQRTDRHHGFFICEQGTRALVGVANLNEVVRGDFQSAYLGYYAFAPYVGNGYMHEGVGLVLRQAFTSVGLHRVEVNIQPKNRSSIALARRLGFVHEGSARRYLKVGGRWRDHDRWALLVEGWRAR